MNNKVAHIIFGLLLAVIAIVPFAIPYAYFPISKFYSESISLICGVLLFAVALFTCRELKFAPVAIASFAFAAFMLLQPLFVKIMFWGNNQYVALLFFILGLVAIAITSMVEKDELMRDKILNTLCWSLVISATIQSIIAYLQYTGKAANYSDWILVSPEQVADGSNIFGNIGQPNQFTDFISIGVVALCYLFFVGQINLIVFIAYSILFALAITFTARRGVLLYFVIIILLGLWKCFINRNDSEKSKDCKRIILIISLYFLGLIMIQFALPKIVALFTGHNESVSTGLNRLSAAAIGQSTYRRFYEWYKAIILFINHPLFGIGWYQYPHEGIYIMLTKRFMYIPQNMKLYTHCHNSLFNMMAETGIIGTFITVIYGIGYSLYLLLKKINTTRSLFVVFLAMPILIHSLLEYPLWYAYFIVILTIFLAFAPAKYTLNSSLAVKTAGGIIIATLMGIAYNAYQVNNQLLSYTQMPSDYDDYVGNVKGLEQLIDSNSMWAIPAIMVLDNYIMPGSQATNAAMSLSEQLKYIDRLANDLPYPGSLFKQIVIHKMVGDNDGANRYANVLVHAYPYYQQQFIQQLSSDPAFADIIATLKAFHYQDKSDLSKLLGEVK